MKTCAACGKPLARRGTTESHARFTVRQTCDRTCANRLKQWKSTAAKTGKPLAEYMAAAVEAAVNVIPEIDNRTELERIRDKAHERLMAPDPEASTRFYRSIAGAKGKALGMGRFNGR